MEELIKTLKQQIITLEKNYGIRLANAAEGKDIFKSVRIMAEYIEKNRKK